MKDKKIISKLIKSDMSEKEIIKNMLKERKKGAKQLGKFLGVKIKVKLNPNWKKGGDNND